MGFLEKKRGQNVGGTRLDLTEVQPLLLETRSVATTATILGVSYNRLSKWLNSPKRKKWWSGQKKRWRRHHEAQRKARWRQKRIAKALCAALQHDPRVWDLFDDEEKAIVLTWAPSWAPV